MREIFYWNQNTPPKNTWVWAKYKSNDDNENWQLLKTCKRGCCVYSAFGTMTLPSVWYLATEAEGIAEDTKWKKIPKINLFDLYSK